jgi:tetratricopeptide (TPR) repeat protein
MQIRNLVWPTISASFLLTCILASPALAQDTTFVEGTVVSNQGVPVAAGVSVRLETPEGSLVASSLADTRGQFKFIGVPRGYYKLTATAEGYQPAQQPLNVGRGGGGRFMVSVMMTPLNQTRSHEASNTVSVTDLSAPKNARKDYEKGEREFGEQKYKAARTSFEKALAEHPCYARAHTRLGMTLEMDGDFPGAERALRKAMECDAGFLEAYAQLGILLNHLKRFDESKSSLEPAAGRFPASWQLHYQLAAAEYGLGRYREAEQEYLKARSSGKDVNPEVHVRLADVYTQLREPDKAYAELREYLQADPTGRFATKVSEVIQRMESEGAVKPAKPLPTPGQP